MRIIVLLFPLICLGEPCFFKGNEMPGGGYEPPEIIYVQADIRPYFLEAGRVIAERVMNQYAVDITESHRFPRILYVTEQDSGEHDFYAGNGYSEVYIAALEDLPGQNPLMHGVAIWNGKDEVDIIIRDNYLYEVILERDFTIDPDGLAFELQHGHTDGQNRRAWARIIERYYREKFLIKILMHEFLHVLGIMNKDRSHLSTHIMDSNRWILSRKSDFAQEMEDKGLRGRYLHNRLHYQTVDFLYCYYGGTNERKNHPN